MDTFAVGEEPTVAGSVVALEGEVAFAQFFVMGVLYQDIFEGKLFAGNSINVRTVGGSGQVLVAVVETVFLVVFEIASCQRIAAGHIDLGSVLRITILFQSIGL